jgi:predicted outer membrane repeat protein
MRIKYLGVFLVVGYASSACVVVEDRTTALTRGATHQTLSASVEKYGTTLLSVSAEVDGQLVPLALDPTTGLYTGAYTAPSLTQRCKPSYSIRYQTVFRDTSGTSVTQYEPMLGHYQHEAWGLSFPCLRVASPPRMIAVQSTSDAELAAGATNCVSTLPGGDCTLRAALTLANNSPGHDVVILASGSTYVLNGGGLTPLGATFHMTISDDLTIRADGPAPATITETGSFGHGLFDVKGASPVTLELQGLTIAGFEPLVSMIGGAITNTNGSLIIDACTFSGNEAYLHGGAIQNRGYLSIDHSTLSNNLAFLAGGAIAQLANSASTTGLPYARIRNSTISNNQTNTAGMGAGIYGDAGTLQIENVTITGNVPRIPGTSIIGGALYVGGSVSALVRQSTLADNTASIGPGIYVAGGTFALTNSIVANNTASGTTAFDVVSPSAVTVNALGTNLVGSCSSTPSATYTCPIAGSSLIVTSSPGLLPLALNAPGTTETFALDASSPARGQGPTTAPNAADITTCEHTDQRGVARSAPCDLGAYQY